MSDEIEDEYKLKLFGLASRQINELFRLLVEFCRRAPAPPGIVRGTTGLQSRGRCGLEVEIDLAVCNLPSRIGKQGVHGCKTKFYYERFHLIIVNSPIVQ